jgi:putative DNA primase/helicase
VNQLNKFTAQLDADIALREAQPGDGVVLTSGVDLRPQPVRWLWKDWLAAGKLHILAGAPGVGKTTLALSIAASITAGSALPDGSQVPAGNVLIWSGEDDPADTLLPRLLAAGADRARCFFITAVRENGQDTSFDPARHMLQLLERVDQIGGVDLLIVDPIVNAVAGNSHQNGEVRRGLQPIVDLAAASGCAVIGITHLSKGMQGDDPVQRVIGSIAFSAVARVVFLAGKVMRNGAPIRVLARGKSNIGTDEGGFEYHLEEVDVPANPGIRASTVYWDRSVEGTARELLSNDEGEDGAANGQVNAIAFLRAELGDGGLVPRNSIRAAAEDAGVSWRAVERASGKLAVIKQKGGMKGGWYWKLAKVPKDAKLDEWQPSGCSGSSAPEEEEVL